ncbi:hypothetical protein BAE44_0008339 [Dichanthelium oligosanthes]|uniref:DUF4220 domain-containing protein n=1 Tax=Dichanthelium oligosanthes TaxID=888268 RepID=A0A1E5VZW2_9POAL|nr:hypothetical protein BAE44_0008339 [Dichanthelium oligosanthes]
MVAASVIMFVLAGVFFNLNLFSGISDVSAILDPKARLVLSSALSLLLPVMSYLFSEAKNAGTIHSRATAGTAAAAATDLTLQAGIILVWMLLVELLRKKVDEIRMQGISSSLQRAGRVVWLGNLVFLNIRSAGRKIVFGILWILCATTVVQRIAFTEFGKRSYAHGKNFRLIASYMAQVLGSHAVPVVRQGGDVDAHGGAELLRRCPYIVMGEDQLVKEATADGYELNNVSVAAGIVTVGDVWSLPESDSGVAAWDGDKDQRLRRLCLSFALFKLLRRRFEQHEPLTKEEASNGRELIFRGLYKPDGVTADAEAVFQVINDDVNFLSEYYHSVVPVIFASPFFLLANYVLLPVVVLGLCLMTIFLCGNGDLSYALVSIHTDNYTIQIGIRNLTLCLLQEITKYPPSFFSLLDLSITSLLFIIFIYESVWELVVFLLSNWFLVSLVCDYTAKHEWREKPCFRWSFRRIRWLRSKMSHGDLTIKQFSVLNLRWPPIIPLPSMLSLLVRARTVPDCVKDSLMEYLVAHDHAAPVSIGMPALDNDEESRHETNLFSNLSWAFESKSIAEVILTWHIATTIFEERFPSRAPSKNDAAAFSMVATRLSKYCAYLVIFRPELLPDNQDKTERVVELMRKELKEGLGCLEFFLFRHAARVERIKKLKGEDRWTEKKVVKNAVTLGVSLLEKAAAPNHSDSVWKMLARVWTELMIYIAPSTDEEHMKGHENALVQGGEFITVLWALTTHTGISRQPMQGAQVHA